MTPSPHFPLLGEPLSLDLVNTRIRRHGVDVNLLDTPAALDAWLRAEGERVSWVGPTSAADLRAVQALQTTLCELFRAQLDRDQPAAAAVMNVNKALAAPPRTRLVWDDQQPHVALFSASSRRNALLHQLAADAVAVLTGPQAQRLRKCANPDCILRFVASHPRRRWCSSAQCGNRARVARHYKLHREAP
jgi:predicted RNA-binding Zn ribbon-like protein